MIDDFSRLLDDLFEDRISQVLIGTPAKIESFDKTKMLGTVIPLLKDQEGTNFTPISNIRAQFIYSGGFYIRPDYKKGDLVWLSFSTYDIDKPLRGEPALTNTKTFSLENCTIVTGIATKKENLPQSFSEDGLLIGKGENFLQVTDDGFIFNIGGKQTSILSDGVVTEGEVTAKNKISPVHLSIHKQAGPAGPPIPA